MEGGGEGGSEGGGCGGEWRGVQPCIAVPAYLVLVERESLPGTLCSRGLVLLCSTTSFKRLPRIARVVLRVGRPEDWDLLGIQLSSTPNEKPVK